jgi:hypothetical protein
MLNEARVVSRLLTERLNYNVCKLAVQLCRQCQNCPGLTLPEGSTEHSATAFLVLSAIIHNSQMISSFPGRAGNFDRETLTLGN